MIKHRSKKYNLVDAQGYAILPQVGKLVVRGMTLTQFEKIAQEALSAKQFTDLKVIASFTELHTIQIYHWLSFVQAHMPLAV